MALSLGEVIIASKRVTEVGCVWSNSAAVVDTIIFTQ